MQTYAVSLHFSAEAENTIESLVQGLAQACKNDFRIKNKIPPHLTLGMYKAESEKVLLPAFESFCKGFSFAEREIIFARAETFMDKAIFLLPDKASESLLKEANQILCKEFSFVTQPANNGLYLPENYFPHIALGTGLSKPQLRTAKDCMDLMAEESYEKGIFAGVAFLALAKTKPYVVVERKYY